MQFIRILTAATKSNNRTKKLVKKPSKKTIVKDKTKNTINKTTKNQPKLSPKKNLTKNNIKNTKPTKTNVKTRNKQVNKRFNIKPKTSIYPLQDESLPTFEELLEQGYNRATFVAWPGACKFCKKLNGKTWTLKNLLDTTEYDAPIFFHSHVNAQSKMKVWDSKGELEPVYVDYTGEIS